jgi:2-oxoglutarate decarboxylase
MAINTTIQVVAPGAGESVTEGEILEWHVEEGGRIEVDQTIVEISTDKVDVEVPAPASGTVVKIHAVAGETITVGQLLAEIQPDNGAVAETPDEPAADVPVAEAPADEPPPATSGFEPEGDTANAPADTEADQDTVSEVIDIVTPAGGESVTEGEILEWNVKVGDVVEADQPIVEISTDKVDMELPAPAAGTIIEILAEAGETVVVGQTIARMKTGGAAASAGTAEGSVQAEPAAPAAASDNGAKATAPDGVKASPVATRVAAAEGVDLASVAGSGPRGRVLKDDVLAAKNGPAAAAAAAPASAPAPAGAGAGSKPIKGAAAALARFMDESRAIPTATSFRTITVTAMDGRRKQLKAGGQKVSFTHLIAYAIALATQNEMPVMAHHFAEVEGKPHRVDDDAVNLGIAVDVTNKKGERTLMVPVILDAGRRDFTSFKGAFDALIDKARTNSLTADDLQGANISLTNPGGIGTIASVPRLMNGQGTIIATGAIAYPVGLGNIGDAIGAEKVMT